MTNTLRLMTSADRIKALYRKNDMRTPDNIVSLNPPLGQTSIAIIEDVQALLEDPATRQVTQDVLKEALSIIASGFIPASSRRKS